MDGYERCKNIVDLYSHLIIKFPIMNEKTPNNEESPLTDEQIKQINTIFDKFEEKFVQIFNVDKLEKNSVIFIKADPTNVDFIMALPLIAKKYETQFKAKGIAMVIAGPGDSVEVLDEKQMSQLGWEKKEKSLIIKPNQI